MVLFHLLIAAVLTLVDEPMIIIDSDVSDVGGSRFNELCCDVTNIASWFGKYLHLGVSEKYLRWRVEMNFAREDLLELMMCSLLGRRTLVFVMVVML